MEIAAAVIALVGTLVALAVNDHQKKTEQANSAKEHSEEMALAQASLDAETNTANNNFALSKEQFEYQKQLNELQMQREDTAMQRQVSDLKAAGLSPLMASGGASTGQLISASAPQYDSSGILSAMSNMLGIRRDYANRKQAAYQFERQMQVQKAQAFADLTSIRLDNEYKREQINAQKIANKYNEEHGLRDPNPVSAITDAVMSYIDSKYPTVEDAIDAGKGKLEEVKQDLHDKVDEALETAKENVKEVPQLYTKPIKKSASTVGKSLKSVGGTIKRGIVRGISKVTTWQNRKKNNFKSKQADRL